MSDDITFCANEECTKDCARKRKPKNKHASYAMFEGGEDCEFFIER